jgi:hypothetical protein
MNLIYPVTKPHSTKTKQKKWLRIGFYCLILIITIRILLPYITLHFINKRLELIHGYYGHVADLDISLYRGAYVIKDFYINISDTTTQRQTPFFSSSSVDISIEWRSLFKGQIVSELVAYSPLLRFTEGVAEPEQLEKDTNDFRQILKMFTPVKVNRFEVYNGKIQYIDKSVTPEVDIFLDNAHVLATNLSNVEDTTLLPATVTATADIYTGKMTFNMQINALANDPTYDMNAEIKGANLVLLNSFFKAYADFDVSQGIFDASLELAARERKYIGYIKPVIKDLKVVGPEDKKDSVLRKLWEGIIGVAADVLENPKTDQIGTKIPLVGNFDDRTIGTWYAVMATLRNGFVQAIYPTLDNQVNIGLVQSVDPKKGYKSGLFKKAFNAPSSSKDKKKNQG